MFVSQISKQQLQTVKERFQAFLSGETQIVADEAFINAVQSYYDVSGTANEPRVVRRRRSTALWKRNIRTLIVSLNLGGQKTSGGGSDGWPGAAGSF